MPRLALLSVSDKTDIIDLGRQLVEEFEFELVSSGGTAKTLQDAGLPVTKVADYTGSPEILGGRVKTLHPRIHGGILARRDLREDLAELEANQIRPLDLVVVNLYPFAATIARPDATFSEAIENIDIGGPTLIRAAAKNHAHLTVLVRPEIYQDYLQQLRDNKGTPTAEFRRDRAAEAFALTATYDAAIAAYFSGQSTSFVLAGTPVQTLRYGENPHQSATWYRQGEATGWAAASQLQGKELSYNNLVDLEAARRLIAEFNTEAAAAILKHTNPCGVALADTLEQAYRQALAADPVSAFGGIVALNQPIDEGTATAVTETFLECVVAPGCADSARDILAKKSKLRVLILPDLQRGQPHTLKEIAGGFLVQGADTIAEQPDAWEIPTTQKPTPEQLAEMSFAWKVAKHVKSNAIVVTKNRATLGIGAGQMNRVGAAKIALEQAGEQAKGAILASDGFFPFDDSVRTAAAAGIAAIVQPGGSLRDRDSIAAADELGIPMALTGIRHFLHS